MGHCRKEGELGNIEIAEVHKRVSESEELDVRPKRTKLTALSRVIFSPPGDSSIETGFARSFSRFPLGFSVLLLDDVLNCINIVISM